MPYILIGRRKELDVQTVGQVAPKNAGELNYCFTRILRTYLRDRNYQRINDVLGSLEGAKLELYRRGVASYEDLKISENGDL